jgi:hypothetical protein
MEDRDLKEAFPFLFKKQEGRTKALQMDHARIFNKEAEKYQSFKEAVVSTLSQRRSSLSQASIQHGVTPRMVSARQGGGAAAGGGTVNSEISIKENR